MMANQLVAPAGRPAAQQPPPRRPFRYGTRQRFAQLPIQSGATFGFGGTFFAALPNVGFLAEIELRLTGIMTLGAPGVLTTFAPWNMLDQIVVRTNLGAGTIYDTNGYANYALQRISVRAHDPQGAIAAGWADPDTFAAGVAAGGNPWTLVYRIPIAQNYGLQFANGLIDLQSPEVQVTLEGRYAPSGASIVSNFTSFTGTLSAGMLYYEVPNPARVLYPPLLLYRTIMESQVISAVGDQIYTVPREGLIHRLLHVHSLNDARSNAWDRVTLRANLTDELYRYERWQLKRHNQWMYAAPLPTGVFVHEWFGSDGFPNSGDNRDMISSIALSTLESVVNDASGAVGGALNRLDTIRQVTQVVRL